MAFKSKWAGGFFKSHVKWAIKKKRGKRRRIAARGAERERKAKLGHSPDF